MVVKSTDGDTLDFSSQDNLFTTHIKGVSQGELVNQVLINAAISRVLQSNAEWQEVLAAVHQPALQTIISNTTEVGIQYVPEKIADGVPASFPGKLLAVLWERFHYFKGSANTGFVIVPTELVVDNGRLIKEILCCSWPPIMNCHRHFITMGPAGQPFLQFAGRQDRSR